MKKLRVGVIYGGRSGEHEVSLASAAAVFEHLESLALRARRDPHREGRPLGLPDRPPTALAAAEVIEQARLGGGAPGAAGREVHLVAYPTEDTILTIDRRRRRRRAEASAVVTGLGLDVIFPVLHGPYGEDGTVQGLLELANVPYVGAGVLASAVGMDKAFMKVVFAARGLPVCPYRVVLAARLAGELGTASLRSHRSAGLSGVRQAGQPRVERRASRRRRPAQDLRDGDGPGLEFDRKIVVEAAVPKAREIECAVLGNDAPEASVAGEVIPSREFYDYEAKYLDDGSTTAHPRGRSTEPQRGRGAAPGDRGVPGGRLRRHGARRLPAVARHRADLRQRGEHDPRLHHHQHVLEALGRDRRRLPGAARSPGRAGPRAARRETAAADQRAVSRRVRRRRLRPAPPVLLAALALGSSRRPARRRRRHRRSRDSRRPTSCILDARFDQAERRCAACAPGAAGGVRACCSATRSWWRILLEPRTTRAYDEFRRGRRAIAGAEAWTTREPDAPRRGSTSAPRTRRACSSACCATSGSRPRATASASRRRSSARSSSTRSWRTRASAIGLYKYYADVAPAAAKVLRFLLLLPGGDRDEA